jgi:hypothetical protein
MPFVQVGTYPTRNFATLGPFMLLLPAQLRARRPSRFRLALHVAVQIGPYHPRMAFEVWHMVSEDSALGMFARPFLLIVRTGRIVTRRFRNR